MMGRGEDGRFPVRSGVWDWVFLLGLMGAAGFVLWLPVFPTGDGPVHLYYADVLGGLLRHQPAYAQDYAVRHLFAPYLVHYLVLLSLEHFVAQAAAEKLFIALIFVTTALGFRFLARSLGREDGVACVWMLPLLFSWSLGGGFLNCCFATGVALWAFGVWTRLGRVTSHEAPASWSQGTLTGTRQEDSAPRRQWRRNAWLLLAYALLLAMLVLSHPVPLLVVLLFTGADLLLHVVDGWRVRPRGLLASRHSTIRFQGIAAGSSCCSGLVAQAFALVMTALAFVAPMMLAQKGQAAAVLPGMGFHGDVLVELLTGMRLGLFAGIHLHTLAGWLALAARISLLAILPGVAVLVSMARSKVSGFELPVGPARRLLLISLVFLAATVFFPRSLNHSYYFPQRMWDIVWLLVLACGARATLSPRSRGWLGGAGLAAMLLTAASGLPSLVPIARAQQELATVPLPKLGRGIFLEPATAVNGHGAATTYPVYSWSGARAFAASHAILLNSPWLGLTILPVRGQQASVMMANSLPRVDAENPVRLYEDLVAGRGAGQQANALNGVDFLLYADPQAGLPAGSQAGPQAESGHPLAAVEDLLAGQQSSWRCSAGRLYALCVRRD